MNHKKFDGGQLPEQEKNLRDFYKRLLNFTINSNALLGNYKEIHSFNRKNTENYNDRVFSFTRWSDDEKLIIISNFDAEKSCDFELKIPEPVISAWKLKEGSYTFTDQIYNKITNRLNIKNEGSSMIIEIKPLESLILKLDE
jgi:glycosidase